MSALAARGQHASRSMALGSRDQRLARGAGRLALVAFAERAAGHPRRWAVPLRGPLKRKECPMRFQSSTWKQWIGGALVAMGAVAVMASMAAQAGSENGLMARSAAASQSLPPGCAAEAAPLPGDPPQHPAPCHGNPNFAADGTAVMTRGDVAFLPAALKNQLTRLACRPHSTLPIQFYSEADSPSQLFQYYLLDTKDFEPNVFTARIPGVNDTAMFTTTGANSGLPTVAAVRLVVEPKAGLPTNPDDPRAFIDIITDISGVFVINNESGWYEGWMIHDLRVAPVAPPRPDGHAQFGTITAKDAARLATMGSGNNVPGHFFTVNGNAPHFPSASHHFPDPGTNA